jgi:hypothetical protein
VTAERKLTLAAVTLAGIGAGLIVLARFVGGFLDELNDAMDDLGGADA